MQKSKYSIWLLVLAALMASPSLFAQGPPPIPDASSSALLMSVGFAGLAFVKKFIR